jgi:hypothetical protein
VKERLRAVLYVLGIFVVLAVFAWVRGETERQDLPAGSSHSSAPNGARALFLWMEATGAHPQRLERTDTLSSAPPQALFFIQPAYPMLPPARTLIDSFMDRGGTIVLAGDSFATVTLAGQLGFTLTRSDDPIERASPPQSPAQSASRFSGADRPVVLTNTNLFVERRNDARVLLEAPAGQPVAVSAPYRRGRVILISSPLPLNNAGLRDAGTARWVYGDLTSQLGSTVYFDEIHHVPPGSSASPEGEPDLQSLMLRWLLRDPVGSAAFYAATLTFLFLLLSGRRLGPALRPVSPGAASRTMYEHVQALAGLYRRGAQFLPLRAHYAHQYRRRVARALGTAAPLSPDQSGPVRAEDLAAAGVPSQRATQIAQAITSINAAGSERQLAHAVRQAEEAVAAMRSARPLP